MNAFDTTKAVYLDFNDLPKGSFVSHLQITDNYVIYIVINSIDRYQVFEKDLDKILKQLLFSKDFSQVKQESD